MTAKKKTEKDKRKARQSKARKTVEKILGKRGCSYEEYEFQQNVNFIFDQEGETHS
ncbi:TPA: hypothetical protein IQA20_002752 [Listeria monocytogenes]|nr:hypothetical protein [Listeria monocytogenes]